MQWQCAVLGTLPTQGPEVLAARERFGQSGFAPKAVQPILVKVES